MGPIIPPAKVSWIERGIEQHKENAISSSVAAQKDVLFDRLKTPEETLQALLEKLHQIGYNEDEIEKILSRGDISKLGSHVKELRQKVDEYIKVHRRHDAVIRSPGRHAAKPDSSNHKPIHPIIDDHEHDHDDEIIPQVHRDQLNAELAKINQMRRELEAEFGVIGFSRLDTYFCISLWLSSIGLVVWFYCGYNCRVCYAHRRPIYRYHHNM